MLKQVSLFPLLVIVFSVNITTITAAMGAVHLAPQYADSMVLQRNVSNPIQGFSDSSETISLWLNASKISEAKVDSGYWQIPIAPMPAGGPHTLSIRTPTQSIEINDVLFGDLWLAGGQSNMEYTMDNLPIYADEITAADYPQVRQFTVSRGAAYDGPLTMLKAGKWHIASKWAIARFSAVSYFFAKQLHAEIGVPIGIINNAYAGSPIQAWISEQTLTNDPQQRQLIERNKDPQTIQQLLHLEKTQRQGWLTQLDHQDRGLQHQWYHPQTITSNWRSISVPGLWAHQGQESFSGSMWFQRSFELTTELANQQALLELGRIVDRDQLYINGHLVGQTDFRYPQRRYRIEPNYLRAGKNNLTVRVISYENNPAGFIPDKPYRLTFNNSQLDLAGLWHYQVGYRMPSALPPYQFRENLQPSGLFNAMLSPLKHMQFTGILWYQGESNAHEPENYANLFPAMIRQWRQQLNQPRLPFIYVQLANYLAATSDPSDSGWAAIRAAQTKGLTEDNTTMVTAIDLGEWNDIHPQNKRAVAQRLANAALQRVYAKHTPYEGAQLTCARAVDNSHILIKTTSATLQTQNDDALVQGFAVSQDDIHYRWVEGKLQGTDILLMLDNAQSIQFVSYAWQSNPTRANLIDRHHLPAFPAKLNLSATCSR